MGAIALGRSHRIAGMMGGFIAGPLSMLAASHCRNRQVVNSGDVFIVQMLASLPGLGVYFVLAWLSDMLFSAARADPSIGRFAHRRDEDDEDYDDEDEQPRGRRRDDDNPDVDDTGRGGAGGRRTLTKTMRTNAQFAVGGKSGR